MKAHELLSNESKWTKGKSAADAQGNPVSEHHPNAICFCIEGACHRIDGSWDGPTWQKLKQYFSTPDNNIRPCEWNDDPRRTFSEVRDLLVKLDI